MAGWGLRLDSVTYQVVVLDSHSTVLSNMLPLLRTTPDFCLLGYRQDYGQAVLGKHSIKVCANTKPDFFPTGTNLKSILYLQIPQLSEFLL